MSKENAPYLEVKMVTTKRYYLPGGVSEEALDNMGEFIVSLRDLAVKDKVAAMTHFLYNDRGQHERGEGITDKDFDNVFFLGVINGDG